MVERLWPDAGRRRPRRRPARAARRPRSGRRGQGPRRDVLLLELARRRRAAATGEQAGRRRSASPSRGRTWGSGRTAGTDRAGPSSARATGSRSSPTTGRSGTSSGTGCSPWSGSGSLRTSATSCPSRWSRPDSRDRFEESMARSAGLYRDLSTTFRDRAAVRADSRSPPALRAAT